jgi:hypothetical protein
MLNLNLNLNLIIKERKMDISETKPEIVSSKGHKSNFKAYLLYASALCLGLFVASMFFKFITKIAMRNIENLAAVKKQNHLEKFSPTPTLQAVIATPSATDKISQPESSLKTQAQYESLLSVNGVFISQGGEKYALINNRIVKKGGSVEGLKLVGITLDELALESSEGLIIKLQTNSK